MKDIISNRTHSELKNNLIFAGTIYDSFEALEEVLGKLKLEKPLFLVYLAKKTFAEEVIAAAEENQKTTVLPNNANLLPNSQIHLNSHNFPSL